MVLRGIVPDSDYTLLTSESRPVSVILVILVLGPPEGSILTR